MRQTYLAEDHGGDLLGGEGLLGAIEVDLDHGLVILGHDPILMSAAAGNVTTRELAYL